MSDDTEDERSLLSDDVLVEKIQSIRVTGVVPYVNYTDALAKIRRGAAGLLRPVSRREAEEVPTEKILSFLHDKEKYPDDFMRAHVYLAVNIEIGQEPTPSKIKIRGTKSDLKGALLSRIGVKKSRASNGPVRRASDLLVQHILEAAADAMRRVSPDEVRRRIEVILLEDKSRHDGEQVNQAKNLLREVFMGQGSMMDVEEIMEIRAQCMTRIVLST